MSVASRLNLSIHQSLSLQRYDGPIHSPTNPRKQHLVPATWFYAQALGRRSGPLFLRLGERGQRDPPIRQGVPSCRPAQGPCRPTLRAQLPARKALDYSADQDLRRGSGALGRTGIESAVRSRNMQIHQWFSAAKCLLFRKRAAQSAACAARNGAVPLETAPACPQLGRYSALQLSLSWPDASILSAAASE